MDFDSLAFGGGRGPERVRSGARRDYCRACLECKSIPEGTADATCPTCGEELSHGPSDQETDLNLARTSLGTGPSPSDRETLEQIGSEVLRFIAAVERGEIPSDAVGLPPAPVGENVPGFLGGDWQGIAGLGGPQGGQGNVPASQAALDKLPRFTVKENSWVLHQTSLRLEGGLEKSFEALFAQFSSPPSQSVVGRLVLADPATGHTDLANASTLDRSIVVVDRGICTFASKALRAQAAGAAAVVVVQSGDVWPYVMEDSKGEANAGGLQIPVSMVSRDDGALIKGALSSDKILQAELSVSSSEKDCIVCQEIFAVGATLFRLPCGHLYHEGCLLKWLKLRNTCPYCRMELPTSNADAERERQRRDGELVESWAEWFS